MMRRALTAIGLVAMTTNAQAANTWEHSQTRGLEVFSLHKDKFDIKLLCDPINAWGSPENGNTPYDTLGIEVSGVRYDGALTIQTDEKLIPFTVKDGSGGRKLNGNFNEMSQALLSGAPITLTIGTDTLDLKTKPVKDNPCDDH